jgi:hypothetical protein
MEYDEVLLARHRGSPSMFRDHSSEQFGNFGYLPHIARVVNPKSSILLCCYSSLRSVVLSVQAVPFGLLLIRSLCKYLGSLLFIPC